MVIFFSCLMKECCSVFVVVFSPFICATVVSELKDKLYMMISKFFVLKLNTIDLHI